MVNVIFQTAFLGDALLSISLIRQLKKLSPAEKVIFVCRPGVGAFFRANPIADEVIELDKKDPKSLADFRKRLKSEPIRYLLVAHQSVRTALLLRSLKAKKKIAYRLWWNRLFYDALIERPMNLPEPLRLLALLTPISEVWSQKLAAFSNDKKFQNPSERRSLPLTGELPADTEMKVTPDVSVVDRVRVSRKLKRPFIAVAPSSQWPTKRYTEIGFAELISKVAACGVNVYLVGSENERGVCERIAQNVQPVSKSTSGLEVKSTSAAEIRSLAGQLDLIELHAFLSLADVVVANDSGSMHMAVVAGRPVVGIFGPTVLEQGYRPWSEQAYIVQNDLDCRPCGKHGHKKCPLGHHNCMKSITAQQVLKGVDQFQSHH